MFQLEKYIFYIYRDEGSMYESLQEAVLLSQTALSAEFVADA